MKQLMEQKKIPVSDNLKNELMTHNELVKNQKLEIIIFQC